MKNRVFPPLCKDCKGTGFFVKPAAPIFYCHTCNGKGLVYRRGPYRLQDGTWSDGVDRRHRINQRPFNGRIQVWKGPRTGHWFAGASIAGELMVEWYHTHKAAMLYADHLARKQTQEKAQP